MSKQPLTVGLLMKRHVLPVDGEALRHRGKIPRVAPDVLRLHLLLQWAKENGAHFELISQLDAADSTVMANMFAPLYPNYYSTPSTSSSSSPAPSDGHIHAVGATVDHFPRGVFTANEILPIKGQHSNVKWLQVAGTTAARYTGMDAATWISESSLFHPNRSAPVLCSGFYGGTAVAFYDFLIAYAAVGAVAPKVHGIDQGYFNLLYYILLPNSGFPHALESLDEAVGPYHHWHASPSAMRFAPDGRLVNCRDKAFAFVHQLNRYKREWAEAIAPYERHLAYELYADRKMFGLF
jgi:hypothetical protein